MMSSEVEWIRLTQFSDFLNPSADFRGCSALHYAVLINDSKLVRLLLEFGADPTIVNERGHRPAMYAKDSSIRDLLAEAESKKAEEVAAKEREERRLQPLENRLRKVIVGQEAAIRTVSAGWFIIHLSVFIICITVVMNEDLGLANQFIISCKITQFFDRI
ncbi:hypothetical protein MS3_00005206 [Schistosoma haematobium]|uniref:ANK_REP_REGION domain-containing protein n=1 Tax=Schistosoma haematobium TaxID=6185 RepID=A0A922RZT5_SCHHA|nr:hypothetical protein MS3_00005206 [Schistosoma haematobium]KAH9587484.1 hypothetical protein MS3_00005206 [Schistosoma haematobium]